MKQEMCPILIGTNHMIVATKKQFANLTDLALEPLRHQAQAVDKEQGPELQVRHTQSLRRSIPLNKSMLGEEVLLRNRGPEQKGLGSLTTVKLLLNEAA